MFVYVIVNSDTLKLYVGQHKGNNLRKYLQTKFSDAKFRRDRGNSRLYHSMRKYPKDVWSIHPIISDLQTQAEVDYWEQFYIRTLHSQHPDVGYNICRGGERGAGRVRGSHLSPETCTKISIAHQGMKHAPASIAKMKESHKAAAAALRGVPRSPEVMAKFHAPEVQARAIVNSIAARKDKPVSPEVRQHISEGKRKEWATRKNRKFSLDRNAKISAAMKGRAPVIALKRAHDPDVEAKRQLTRFLKTVAWG